VRLIVCLALCAAGCVTWQSVKATASLGERVAAHAHSLDQAAAYCRLLTAAGNAPAQACETLEADRPGWRLVATRIGAYSEALRHVIEDKKEPNIHGDVADAVGAGAQVVWRGVPAEQASLVGMALEALFKAASLAYRERALKDTLGAAAPHVRTLVAFVRGELALERDNLATLQTFAEGTAAGLIDVTPVEAAARASLVLLSVWAASETAALDRYDAALAAFGAAHEQLAASAARPDFKDSAVYAAIVDRLKDIYDASQREHHDAR
jgi:hypothetical protein